jgi:hypothetical protein
MLTRANSLESPPPCELDMVSYLYPCELCWQRECPPLHASDGRSKRYRHFRGKASPSRLGLGMSRSHTQLDEMCVLAPGFLMEGGGRGTSHVRLEGCPRLKATCRALGGNVLSVGGVGRRARVGDVALACLVVVLVAVIYAMSS